MLDQVFRCRPEITVGRRDDTPAGQSQQQAGEVGIGADGARGDDRVVVGDTEHSFIETPMAEFTKRHTVANIIILAFAPGDDVRGLHHRMTIRGDNPDAAQGTAMIVRADNDSSEALVPCSRPVLGRLDDLLHQRKMRLLLQHPAVVKGIPVDHRLFAQQRLSLGGKAGLQQRLPQRLPPFPALHDLEQTFIEPGSQGVLAQVADGGCIVDVRRGDDLARLGGELPEGFAVESGKGEGDAAGLAQGDNAPPVEIEEVVQLNQVAGDGDERGGDDASVHEVEHGQ